MKLLISASSELSVAEIRALLTAMSSGGSIEKTLISEKDVGPYVVRVENWTIGNGDVTEMTSAYTHDGAYIGNEEDAKRLYSEYGIIPEVSQPGHKVCSIGKSETDGKWYGWSHRAIHGFKVGDKIKKGDCAYTPEKGEWTISTEEEAKEAAKDFAESVSTDLLPSPGLPSQFQPGNEVQLKFSDTVPALRGQVLAVTFIAGKVLYTVAVYTGNTDASLKDQYGLMNAIGWDSNGKEYLRFNNIDSTFVQPANQ